VVGSPSTSTTTSTVPCSATIDAVTPSSVGLRPNGRIDDDIVVSITTNGSCLPLVLSFDPDTTDTDETPEELLFNGSTVVVIDKNAYVWNQPGALPWTVPLELREGSNGPVADTDSFTVTS